MGWRISLIENTVVVSQPVIDKLFEAGEGHLYESKDEVAYHDELSFNPDHMEHMDWVGEDRYQSILLKHKVEGSIKFGSLDGDNFGKFWGYKFDGQGGVTKTKGELVWTPDTPAMDEDNDVFALLSKRPRGPNEYEIYYNRDLGADFGKTAEEAAHWWARAMRLDFQEAHPGSKWVPPKTIQMRGAELGDDWVDVQVKL